MCQTNLCLSIFLTCLACWEMSQSKSYFNVKRILWLPLHVWLEDEHGIKIFLFFLFFRIPTSELSWLEGVMGSRPGTCTGQNSWLSVERLKIKLDTLQGNKYDFRIIIISFFNLFNIFHVAFLKSKIQKQKGIIWPIYIKKINIFTDTFFNLFNLWELFCFILNDLRTLIKHIRLQ